MKFYCNKPNLRFLATAPIRFDYREQIGASCAQVFSILDNPKSWPDWFPGMTHATTLRGDSEPPTRTVTLNYVIRFQEEFLIREAPYRLVYRVSSVSIPYAESLIEEFTCKPNKGGAEIRYRVGLQVHHSLKHLNGLVAKIGAQSYQKALPKLRSYVEAHALS